MAEKTDEELVQERRAEAIKDAKRALKEAAKEDDKVKYKKALFVAKSLGVDLKPLAFFYPGTEEYVFNSDKPKQANPNMGLPKLDDEGKAVVANLYGRAKYLTYMDTQFSDSKWVLESHGVIIGPAEAEDGGMFKVNGELVILENLKAIIRKIIAEQQNG